MNIIPLQAFTDNYIWLLHSNNNKAVVCVDPGDAKPVIEYLSKNHLELTGILLTHHHPDHSGGIEELIHHSPTTIIYGPLDSRLSQSLPILHQSHFKLNEWHFEVLETPGHTATHICFYEKKFKLLFCGDTLFSAGCGRIFDGSYEMLYHTLENLKKLPEETNIYCGHEYTRENLRFALTVEPNNSIMQHHYKQLISEPGRCSLPSTIGLEKKINPFFRLDNSAVKQYISLQGGNISSFLSIFTHLREAKNRFS